MTNVKVSKSKGTVKAEFKASVSRKEDKLIDAIDRKKKASERHSRPLRGNIRVWRKNDEK